MAVKIDQKTLEKACKEIIETILFCLPNAYKGTVYHIGKPPELVSTCVTSGVIDGEKRHISWSLEESSGYNPPGKRWIEYRDEPGRPLEAMAWCVEKQKSWTSEDPKNDSRSVRMQVEGVRDDFHHMEPVLIHKKDIFNGKDEEVLEYPSNYYGDLLWQNSEYVVAAVIKIHFIPGTIRMGSPETRVIKKLSKTLGTELLSYQLRHQSLEIMRQLAEDKLNSCNMLAHALRNAVAKSGLILSLIKLELGSLREQWEETLLQYSDKKEVKREAIHVLNTVLEKMDGASDELVKNLSDVQNRFLELSLPPEMAEHWVQMQIEEKWNKFLNKETLTDEQRMEIHAGLDKLKKSLYLGKDPDILANYDKVPDSLKKEWTDLIYSNVDHPDLQFLDRVSRILEDRSLNLPHQEKSRKSLVRLKALAEIICQLEENTNMVLQQVLNGKGKEM